MVSKTLGFIYGGAHVKCAKLFLSLLLVAALGACSSSQEAPDLAPSTTHATVSDDAAGTTLAPQTMATTEAQPSMARETANADGSDTALEELNDLPMTAEELEATGAPMDGDVPATEAEAENIREYNECVADLEAEYEPDMGMTDDRSICDDILLMNNEIDTQLELMDGLSLPCMIQLEEVAPELFDARRLEDIVTDPKVIQECKE